MTAHCRHATSADLPVLNQFQCGIIETEAQYIPRRQKQRYRYYDLAALLEDEETRMVVAEADGKLVSSGYVQKRPSKAYLEHSHHGYIGFIYTLPDFRGQGIARQILTTLSDEARAMGLDELRLEVFAGNRVAINTYEKAGFVSNLIEMRCPL